LDKPILKIVVSFSDILAAACSSIVLLTKADDVLMLDNTKLCLQCKALYSKQITGLDRH
jgi:hypothetical protein